MLNKAGYLLTGTKVGLTTVVEAWTAARMTGGAGGVEGAMDLG
jgi:hypothetical protein